RVTTTFGPIGCRRSCATRIRPGPGGTLTGNGRVRASADTESFQRTDFAPIVGKRQYVRHFSRVQQANSLSPAGHAIMNSSRVAMRIAVCSLLTVAATTGMAQSPSEPPPLVPREFRGVWVATVANIDWPSKP